MAVTSFGKELRILRLERDLILKDMASTLNMSSAMLSAIELGKRKIPKGMIDQLQQSYNLNGDQTDRLHLLSIESEKFIEFDLSKADSDTAKFLTTFARRQWQNPDKEKLQALMKMLEED